jgi:hypothetical protein
VVTGSQWFITSFYTNLSTGILLASTGMFQTQYVTKQTGLSHSDFVSSQAKLPGGLVATIGITSAKSYSDWVYTPKFKHPPIPSTGVLIASTGISTGTITQQVWVPSQHYRYKH